MKKSELAEASRPESVVENVARHRDRMRDGHQEHPPAIESVREASYGGHRIVVRTSYRIEVDGVPIQGHVGVTNDGRVHYHAIPNLSFSSAIELVEKLIDAFPGDFPEEQDAGSHRHGEGS